MTITTLPQRTTCPDMNQLSPEDRAAIESQQEMRRKVSSSTAPPKMYIISFISWHLLHVPCVSIGTCALHTARLHRSWHCQSNSPTNTHTRTRTRTGVGIHWRILVERVRFPNLTRHIQTSLFGVISVAVISLNPCIVSHLPLHLSFSWYMDACVCDVHCLSTSAFPLSSVGMVCWGRMR